MNSGTLSEAQDYLTVEKDDGYKRIVDIHNLLQRHNINEVIDFLKDYLKGKEKALKNLIIIDKTHHKVDQYVAAMFRMTMAIKTLEGKEAAQSERSEQRTTKSGKLHKRNSGSNSGPRKWQNRSDDAAHRPAGDETQRAA
jgi:FtsZ-binding cell division protein ZapB